jgi:hypothetical protein
MMLECQIRDGGQWETVDIEEALSAFKGKQMRCTECKGPVCAHKPYSNGTPAHFEHISAHIGCSQIPSNYCGIKSSHPGALG